MHRSPLKNLTISTKYASKLGNTTFGISRYIKETDLLKQSEKATIRFPTNFCNNRLYHCKTSVYGFNASLQKRRAEEALDPKSHGFEELPQQRAAQPNLHRFVDAYRRHGHKIANTNPVKPPCEEIPDILQPSHYMLDSSIEYNMKGVLFSENLNVSDSTSTVQDLAKVLQKTYCDSIALDTTCVDNQTEQDWLYQKFENLNEAKLSTEDKKSLATEMIKSQNFDNFLATKFSNVKRYGGEGAEGMMGFFTELLGPNALELGLEEIIIGMPHRGRLNLLTGMLQFPPVVMFRKMKGLPEFPPTQRGAGDVLSHLTSSVDLKQPNGSSLHVTMLPNPSHLEAVNPVAAGKVRARHMSQKIGDYSWDSHIKGVNDSSGLIGDNILCVQVHGDAAIAGQGINQEILAMSKLPHYAVGGSLHLVVDNQVGFTTPSERGKSSRYSSDIAYMVGAPVVHVNGDDPENVVKATRLALQYRMKFNKDVFVEIHCVRRWGHNELDDPTFTNPLLYTNVNARLSIPDDYLQKLNEEGCMTREEGQQIVKSHNDLLNADFQRIESYQPQRETLNSHWANLVSASHDKLMQWDTGLPADLLKYIGAKSVAHPSDLNLHSQLAKMHVDGRLKRLQAGAGLVWGDCEALALGSLLYQGFNVRISGQDVGRATFAHRHAMLIDQISNEMYIPLNDLDGDHVGNLEIANSPLSEEAVLGFEYGFSIENPKNFVIWEAQFGDFFNGAQIILDTFISNGESKWGLQSAITLLLPHGMDGAGPEHSSCRIERFLQMSDSSENSVDGDDVNWHIVNPTTAGQYFHLLRRQMIRNFRKPLVVVAPKILLRMSAASSTLNDMGPGTFFNPVLGDSKVVDRQKVKKVIFVSGKHYYALEKKIEEEKISDTAIIRIEQLCPFPVADLQNEISKYPNAKKFVWSQEEHRNMGAWSFIEPRFRNLVGVAPMYVGRSELCQPAVGVASVHRKEEQLVLDNTISA